MKLTVAQLRQLLNLLEDKKEKGEYYGNKKQYMRRQKDIITEIEAELEERGH